MGLVPDELMVPLVPLNATSGSICVLELVQTLSPLTVDATVSTLNADPLLTDQP
jgi:hypothetical protein